MTDVTIPQDVAKDYAADLRKFGPNFTKIHALADLLDPPPAPTLRELVAARIWPGWGGLWGTYQLDVADAVLAVVADWLAAQPLAPSRAHDGCLARKQRDEDVRLIRGES